jgi:hypothetical protein
MPVLRLTDGQKRLLLSLPGVWQHKWLFVREHALPQQQDAFRDFRDLWNSLRHWQSHGEGRARPTSYSPIPAVECPSRR